MALKALLRTPTPKPPEFADDRSSEQEWILVILGVGTIVPTFAWKTDKKANFNEFGGVSGEMGHEEPPLCKDC